MSSLEPVKKCKNCGEPLELAYCPRCGQSANVDVPTLNAFLHDAASAVFTYDSKFWRTLKPLVLNPGFLSVEYVEGRRVPYANPVSLYFWLQAICFLGFKLTYTAQAAEGETRAKIILLCTIVSALYFAIVYIPKKRKFAESVVFSLHLNAFLLLWLTLVYPLTAFVVQKLVALHWIPVIQDVGPITTLAAVLVMVPYAIIAMLRFYGEHLIWILLKVVVLYYVYFFFFSLLSRWFRVG